MKEAYEIPSIEIIKFGNTDSVIMEISGIPDNEVGDGGWED